MISDEQISGVGVGKNLSKAYDEEALKITTQRNQTLKEPVLIRDTLESI